MSFIQRVHMHSQHSLCVGEVDPVLMSLIQRQHMHSRHSLCVGEVDPVLMSLIQRQHMHSRHSLWGQCKSWTLDSGLDCGLDSGLEYGLKKITASVTELAKGSLPPPSLTVAARKVGIEMVL